MKTFLLFVLVASALSAHAQDYYLNLDRQRLTMPARPVAVEQVPAGRRGDLTIGYALRGLSYGRPCITSCFGGTRAWC